MKLSNEVFTDIFCSEKRPKFCFYENNLCCMFCFKKEECLKINKELSSKILPCVNESEEDDEICEFLI